MTSTIKEHLIAAHTPGEWSVENDDRVIAPNGDVVAQVYLSISVPETGAYNIDPSRSSEDGRVLRLKANARLIAAAPDLQSCLKRLEANGFTQATWALCEKAIAKAEGRQP